MAIRKLTYAPPSGVAKPQPSVEVHKEFMMSSGLLHLETSLDKEVGVRLRLCPKNCINRWVVS